jgi:signal transduction histidine kinase
MHALRRVVWVVAVLVGGLTVLGATIGSAIILSAFPHGAAPRLLWALVVAVSGLAALGAVLIGGWIGVQSVGVWVGQLTALRDFTRRVGHPDPPEPVTVLSADELGELAYALNAMATRLAQTTAERTAFLTAVAHDLRTPLTALIAQVEGMLNAIVPATPDRLAALATDLARLHRLVEDVWLLATAPLGDGPPLRLEAVDPARVTRRVVERFEPLAELRAMTVECRVTVKRAPFEADPARLDTVLGNLVHNAIRHGEAGTAIRVGLEPVADTALLWTIRNHGPTLSPARLQALTEPFTREDPARSPGTGSGLGLAIAQYWVDRHGGTLSLQYVAGEVVATVQWPVQPRRSDPPSPPTDPATA